MKYWFFLAALFCVTFIHPTFSQVPDAMTAPDISAIQSTSCNVTYQAVSDASEYIITVVPRHCTASQPPPETTGDLSKLIQNLTPGTKYDVSLQARNSFGTGAASNSTEFLTLPGPPTLHLGTPLPNAVDIFFNTSNSVAITQWDIKYQVQGTTGNPATEEATAIYSHRLNGLIPDTTYEIWARPAQLNGTTTIPESGDQYSSIITFTTDSLSVFGRVVLSNLVYTPQYRNQYGDDWNNSREIIAQAYESIPNNGISIIRIEDDNNNPLVHYRIKVKDPSLPSPTDFTLSGSNFSASFINNGDHALGTPYMYMESANKWLLVYAPDETSSCSKLVERYMIVTPDDGPTIQIHLNVASSESTTSNEDDSLRIQSDGDLVKDDGQPAARMSPNALLVLTPRFLVKDCVTGQTSTSLYTEYFQANDAFTSNTWTNVYEMIDPSPSLLDTTAIDYDSADGISVSLKVPAVDKAIKYEVLNGSDIVAILEDMNIDASDCLKITVNPLLTDETYSFNLRVTTRNYDGTMANFTTSSFSVTPEVPPTTTTTTTTQSTAASTAEVTTAVEITSSPETVPSTPSSSQSIETTQTTGLVTVSPGPSVEVSSSFTENAQTTTQPVPSTNNIILTSIASTAEVTTGVAVDMTPSPDETTPSSPPHSTVAAQTAGLFTISGASSSVTENTRTTASPVESTNSVILTSPTSATTAVKSSTTVPPVTPGAALPTWGLVVIIVVAIFLVGAIIGCIIYCVMNDKEKVSSAQV